MGVRRAVEMTAEAIDAAAAFNAVPSPKDRNTTLYTLGPLIHNPQVLASLAGRGVKILEETEIDNADAFTGSAVIILRAHGISPGVEQTLRKRKFRIIDATCPRVKANQNTAFALAKKGYLVFLAGEKDHAELKGIYGYIMAGAAHLASPCIIVGNPEEADHAAGKIKEQELRKNGGLFIKTALIGQTTISGDEYRLIAEALKEYFPDLEIKNTICDATRERQNALRDLCSQVEAVVIAGGKDSANTRRLLSIAEDCGKPAWLAETAADLPPECRAFKTIGLCAGASTPDTVIDEIEQALI
jgi:4-hydroxy-3-methylbut-2-enyl diphosphate reductase